MDRCNGEILLLGEGDFSFSIAFAKKLGNQSNIKITSTTLLSEEELNPVYKSASKNVEIIKQLGVSVFFSVDATTIDSNPCFQDQLYDYIIFNFPHTGGKSNIKNNRKLLKSMFSSVEKKLKDTGQIILSLCCGQGGCPAEEKIRAWHDSWQVVGMAAYSNLTLQKIVPFEPDVWDEYSSTGFKSLDRHFYTGGALTYFFVKSVPFKVPFCAEPIEETVACQIDGINVKINQYVQQKVNRNLLHTGQHPLTLVAKRLETQLNKNASTLKIMHTGLNKKKIRHSPKIRKRKIQTASKNAAVDKEQSIESVESQRRDCIDMYYHVEPVADQQQSAVDNDSSGIEIEKIKSCFLRSTLFDCEENFDSVDDLNCVLTCYGDVYRRTWASSDSLPVQHEFLLLGRNMTREQVEKLCDLNNLFSETNTRFSLTDLGPGSDIPLWYEDYLDRDTCWTLEAGYKSSNAFNCLSCNQVSAKGPPTIDRKSIKTSKLSKIIAYGGQVKSLHFNSDDEVKNTHAVIFNLDALTQIVCDIPDVRLLWSDNPAFLSQYKHKENSTHDMKFDTISYFPPLWRHDLSFWEKDGEYFNEEMFLDLVRNIAGDALEQVILMNVWKDPDTGRTSKCYRQVYQSFDQPLSHEKAHQFQNAIRLNVEKIMGVELR